MSQRQFFAVMMMLLAIAIQQLNHPLAAAPKVAGFGQPSASRLFKCCPSVKSLFVGRLPLAYRNHAENDRPNRNNGVADDTRSRPPVLRRFVIALFFELLLIPSCYLGERLRYRGRRWLGSLATWLSFGLFALSVLLLYLSSFLWSWNWPL